MARPKKAHTDEVSTSAKILAAARIEFAQHGLAARLEDIAKHCDISRASLLHHFESKTILLEALFVDVIDRAKKRIIDVIASSNGSYNDIIQGVLAALRLSEVEDKGAAAVMLRALMANPPCKKLSDELHDLFKLVSQLANIAGVAQYHKPEITQAVIAHIFMGELSRLALMEQASLYWGDADAVAPLVTEFFHLGTQVGETS
jgi:AcrR family transcriptional regulator